MQLKEKDKFMAESLLALEKIYNDIEKLKSFNLDDGSRVGLIIIDMVNGFVKEGLMASPRIKSIIEPILEIKAICDEKGASVVALCDCHLEDSVEFLSYPKHCVKGTNESEIIDELKGVYAINKNSTNGFLEDEFIKWLGHDKDTFIVVGDCTDICVKQFAITLKTWFNMNNRMSKVVVPINAVETYDSDCHNAELINVMSIYDMMQSGIDVVKNIVRG